MKSIRRLRLAVLLLFAGAALALGSGCASHCQAMAHRPAPVAVPPPSDQFGPRPMLVFRPAGSAPVRPILLLHEIPGFNDCTAALADNLVRQGFTVYAPVLLGKPLESGGWVEKRNMLSVILDPAWPTFARERSPAVLKDLRDTVREIRRAHPDAAIGVIGMCMTGVLPLALMSEEHVMIAAICQPSLPFNFGDARRRDLGLSPADRDAGIKRIKERNLRVLGYRFESDTISPHARMVTLGELLPDHFKLDEIGLGEQPEKNHATFTFSYDDTSGSPTQKRFTRLVEAFTAALSAPP